MEIILVQPHDFWIINKQLNGVKITHDVLLLPLPQSSRDHPTQHFSCAVCMHIWKNSWNSLTQNAFQNTYFYDNDTWELCDGMSGMSAWVHEYEWCECMGSSFWQYILLGRGKSEILALEIKKATKTFRATYWNRLGWTEAYEITRTEEITAMEDEVKRITSLQKKNFTVIKTMIVHG